MSHVEDIDCAACRAGLPFVWHVQSRKTMHEGPGLSVIPCDRLDAQDRRARSIEERSS